MDIESITNKIINADCMDILKQLPDKCIDLVVTDPPYGIKMAKNTNICSKTGLRLLESKCWEIKKRTSTVEVILIYKTLWKYINKGGKQWIM